jgi:hypothetical protein
LTNGGALIPMNGSSSPITSICESVQLCPAGTVKSSAILVSAVSCGVGKSSEE